MNNMREYLSLLVDYTTLVYHEARNVRHLIKIKVFQLEPWWYLTVLPHDKYTAWKALQEIRLEAKNAETVRAALLPFERRFKVDLVQLKSFILISPGVILLMVAMLRKELHKWCDFLLLQWKKANRKK